MENKIDFQQLNAPKVHIVCELFLMIYITDWAVKL